VQSYDQASATAGGQAPLLGMLAAQQAQQLGNFSSMQQAQLAQVAALAGDDRTLTMVGGGAVQGVKLFVTHSLKA
jgi:hypothetical protein